MVFAPSRGRSCGYLKASFVENVSSDAVPNEECFAQIEGRSWGFAYVKSRTEKKLITKLTAREIPCYLPFIRNMRIHNRGKVYTNIPMFPSYVFLCLNGSEMAAVKGENEVVAVNIVDESLENSFIKELNAVRKFELFSLNRKTLVNPEIQPGQTVLIKKGPLQNTEVVVIRRLGEVRIVVNLQIFGRSCECNVSAEELKLLR